MRYCPNCGELRLSILSGLCGCTWDEQAKAHRINEAKRRQQLDKEGRPVVVDDLKRRPCW